VRTSFWTLFLLLSATIASTQSLGDVARREKKRRENNQRAGTEVRTITDADVRPAPPVVHRPGTEPEGDAENVEPASPVILPGAPAPNFSLPDRSGRAHSLASFRGRPVLIDFWATWCGPCRQTMPEVERLHQKYARQLQVVGINIEGNSPDVLSYLDDGNYTFQVLFDSGNWESPVANIYGVNSIPRTFLLDRNSRILYSGHPQGLTEELLEAAVASR
jgi:thiol-disulfide isomerase/thioredoxin